MNLKPAKHEEVAIFEENQRIPNVCRSVELRSNGALRQGRQVYIINQQEERRQNNDFR